MIYVSSACVKNDSIQDSVRELSELGYRNIELSGGTQHYPTITADLLRLKEEYGLNYLCHNYFPPPQAPFILNLASQDEPTFRKSLAHVLGCIMLSGQLGADRYAVHAGFLLDLRLDEIGKKVGKRPLFDRQAALETFGGAIQLIGQAAKKRGVKLYVENNVLSHANHQSYQPQNPFFFCDQDGLEELHTVCHFTPLVDVAHLKVSCRSLGLDFAQQLAQLCAQTDYIHISDNDGLADTNQPLTENSELFLQLQDVGLRDKVVTLEVYTGPAGIRQSFDNVLKLMA